jgi:hypothetical protein
MPAEDGRQLCILYATVIGDGVKWLLPMSDGFSQHYQLLPYWLGPTELCNHRAIPEANIDACDLLLCQHPDAISFSNEERDAYEDFLKRFPAHCRKITLPYPHFRVFWPFDIGDPDNDRPPLAFFAPWDTFDPVNVEPHWPRSDSFVSERLKEGDACEEVIAKYLALDVAAHIDLAGLLHQSLSNIEKCERHTDIKVADLVANTYLRHKVFSTLNQPSNALFLAMANRILGQLGYPAVPEQMLDRLQPLIKREMPVHPSIGRYFGLNYIKENTRYLVNRRRYLTFSEYIHDYVRFVWAAEIERRPPKDGATVTGTP